MPRDGEQTEIFKLVREAVELYESPLIAYASVILHGDVERAKDVAQDTFLRLWHAEPEKVRTGLKSWLYTVCRNRALDILRKDQRLDVGNEEKVLSFQDDRPCPATQAETAELGARAWELMEHLSANQKEVLRLKFQHDCSYKDIARITGLTIGNVGFLAHMGLRKLRELLTLELDHTPN